MNISATVKTLTVYGLTHALVDASCVYLLFGGIDANENLLNFIVLYNILAFGLQLPFGWIIDRIQKPVFSSILGCILVSSSLLLFLHPLLSIILAGIGNALFHIGGGIVSLNLKPGKASMPGLFVAPGGIGLFIGALLVKLNNFHPTFFVISLLAMGICVFLVKSPQILYEMKAVNAVKYRNLIILLLLITICIRSLIGLSVSFAWKSDMNLMIILTGAIALGKGLGGFIADRFGWIKVAVGGLVFSSLFLFFGSEIAGFGIVGFFLFNFTMPVCLVAISNILPGQYGFSFGLTTLAIVSGALPTLINSKLVISNNFLILTLMLTSSLLLYIGLKLYFKYKPKL